MRQKEVTVVAVGLKELKAHLSAYVAKAKSGEHVDIIDRSRGEQVAELAPLSPERQAMLQLVAERQGRLGRRQARGLLEHPHQGQADLGDCARGPGSTLKDRAQPLRPAKRST